MDRYTHSDCQPQCHQVSCRALKLSCEEPLSIPCVCVVCVEGGEWVTKSEEERKEAKRERGYITKRRKRIRKTMVVSTK